jgi:hypothetical protein
MKKQRRRKKKGMTGKEILCSQKRSLTSTVSGSGGISEGAVVLGTARRVKVLWRWYQVSFY